MYFLQKDDIIAEVFCYVTYVNINYSVKNSTVDGKYLLYFFMSFQMVFLNNQLYWHFLYCFGFNLVEKVNIYYLQSTVEFLTE